MEDLPQMRLEELLNLDRVPAGVFDEEAAHLDFGLILNLGQELDVLSLEMVVPGVHVVDQDGEQDGVVVLRPAEAFVARDDADERRPRLPVDLGPFLDLDQLYFSPSSANARAAPSRLARFMPA